MKNYFKTIIVASVAVSFVACSPKGPEEISFDKDQCDHCQMTISDANYAAELITEKGRVYKFDDISCMLDYQSENADKTKNAKLYVADFETKKFIPLESATLIYGGDLESPMGGNTAAFSSPEKAKEVAKKVGASLTPEDEANAEEHHHDHSSHEGHSH